LSLETVATYAGDILPLLNEKNAMSEEESLFTGCAEVLSEGPDISEEGTALPNEVAVISAEECIEPGVVIVLSGETKPVIEGSWTLPNGEAKLSEDETVKLVKALLLSEDKGTVPEPSISANSGAKVLDIC